MQQFHIMSNRIPVVTIFTLQHHSHPIPIHPNKPTPFLMCCITIPTPSQTSALPPSQPYSGESQHHHSIHVCCISISTLSLYTPKLCPNTISIPSPCIPTSSPAHPHRSHLHPLPYPYVCHQHPHLIFIYPNTIQYPISMYPKNIPYPSPQPSPQTMTHVPLHELHPISVCPKIPTPSSYKPILMCPNTISISTLFPYTTKPSLSHLHSPHPRQLPHPYFLYHHHSHWPKTPTLSSPHHFNPNLSPFALIP